jgi:hypothetical protein
MTRERTVVTLKDNRIMPVDHLVGAMSRDDKNGFMCVKAHTIYRAARGHLVVACIYFSRQIAKPAVIPSWGV